MEKSQTKRAVQARKWRNSARDQRRLNKVINSYVFHKYRNIYDECHDLFIALKEKYPALGPKCDLTKTRMFRRIIEDSDSSNSEENTTKTVTSAPSTAGHFATETVTAAPSTAGHFATETVTAAPSTAGHFATETVTAAPSTAGHFATETVTAAPSTAGHFATETVTATPSTAGHFATETVTEAPLTAAHFATEPVQSETIPVQHLHVGFNSYGKIVEQLTDEGEYVSMNSVNDEAFNDIIRELERDESIQQLLNDIEIQPIEEEIDADEGIGLNAENEDDELDFNIEFDF